MINSSLKDLSEPIALWRKHPTGQFFFRAQPDLEAILSTYLKELVLAIDDRLKLNIQHILLTGFYGRSEGSIDEHRTTRCGFLNPLELLIIAHKPKDPHLQTWVQLQKIKGEKHLQTKCLFFVCTPHDLKQQAGTRLAYDWVHHSQIGYGDPSSMANYREFYPQGRLNPIEATYLLWKGGCQILKAREKILSSCDLSDIVQLHYSAKIALGDALVIIFKYYSPLLRARHATLMELSLPNWKSDILAMHQDGIAHHFMPTLATPHGEKWMRENQLLIHYWKEVFLYVEKIRLKYCFLSLEDYAQSAHHHERQRQHRYIFNLAKNTRFLLQHTPSPRPLYQSQHQSLFRSLAGIMSESTIGTQAAQRAFFPPFKTTKTMGSYLDFCLKHGKQWGLNQMHN